MKKWVVSVGVIFLFVYYSWHQQQEQSGIHLVLPTSSVSSNTSSPTPIPSVAASGSSTPPTDTPPLGSQVAVNYKDGTYTGSVADAFYGNIQVQAIIQKRKIVDVTFLQYPNDRGTSIAISQQAMPLLKQEAIQSQSSQVDIVSGATDSSQAFIQSLADALKQAK